ncbi:MAG: hypothetical protein EU542_02565 [Promethearchaeota archaeon]|jgi:hypothetical protein|nr:MAG: hypothetical protein EU542_02565 [Candidatus Lokiarchaeota archaeon]
MAEVKTESKITAPKLLAFIGMLYTLALGITYFYAAAALPLYILWGIICILIAFLIFVSLELIDFGPLKIPYYWWIILIFGIVLILFAYFFIGNYFPGILLCLAALIDLIMQKKPYKASKIMVLVGIGFSIYECFVLFLSGSAIAIVNGVFGLILLILLIIVLFELVDLKVIDYSWWFLLLVGFVIFTWVSPFAFGFPVVGNGGTLLLIGFLMMLLAL